MYLLTVKGSDPKARRELEQLTIEVRLRIASTIRQICRLYPFVSGQHRISTSRFLTWMCNGVEMARGRYGTSYIVADLSDSAGRTTYFFGYNDRKVFDVISCILHESDHGIDIGANYGTYTILMAKRVGPSGLVHSFEPQAKLCSMLYASIAANRFQHVFLHKLALSDHDGEESLYTSPESSSIASLCRSGDAGVEARIKVRVRNADEALREAGHAKLLKIDVEEHELVVLGSATRYLKETPPDYLLFEQHRSTPDFWGLPVPLLLRSMGYSRIYELPRRVFRTRLRLIPGDGQTDPASSNFLGVHDGVSGEEIEGLVIE